MFFADHDFPPKGFGFGTLTLVQETLLPDFYAVGTASRVSRR